MNLRDRIRRLERGACSCRDEPLRPLVYYPEPSRLRGRDEPPEAARCERCGRELEVLVRVVYEDADRGAW